MKHDLMKQDSLPRIDKLASLESDQIYQGVIAS